MKEKLKTAWNSRVGFGLIMLVAGICIGYFLMPEKVRVEIKTEVQYVDKIVEKVVTKWKTKTVEVEKQISKTTHKVTHPDGTIVEDTVFESNTQQITRIEEQYKELMLQKEVEWTQKYSYLKEQIGKKHFTLFGGAGLDPTDFGKPKYNVGIMADMWGPLNIGINVTTNPDVFLNIGIRF